ncbi:MAG: four helix bundle protein [Spirosomaceae bacterium]|nr:four helix bundle protein [Spirosomataceae bacterium]
MKYTTEEKDLFANQTEKRLKFFKDYVAQHYGKQLVRASSSAAANYRAARRGRSKREFFAKISIVIEELDESIFWMEMLILAEILTEKKLSELMNEGEELLKILSKARSTTYGYT